MIAADARVGSAGPGPAMALIRLHDRSGNSAPLDDNAVVISVLTLGRHHAPEFDDHAFDPSLHPEVPFMGSQR